MKRLEVPGAVRFVTCSCEHRLPFFSDPLLADCFVETLAALHRRLLFELYAWVVMPEHTHLLLRPRPDQPLDRILLSLKLAIAKSTIARWRRQDDPRLQQIIGDDGAPQFWLPGGGFDRNVRDEEELCREIRYIHRNPVERNLVKAPQDWKWSSVRWWMGQRDGELPCDLPPGNPAAWAAWRSFM